MSWLLRSSPPLAVLLTLSLGLAPLAGCSGSPAPTAKGPEWTPANETKCKVAKSQSRPLIVEWPSSDRVALESSMKDAIVAVRANGCEVEVLSHCKAQGKTYGYRGTTKEADSVSISNEDELYANLPLGAAGLSAKLQSSGSLGVSMAVVGRYVADAPEVTRRDLRGDECEKATHFISAVSVGAFTMFSGGAVEAGAGVDAKVVGAGARTASRREELKSGGSVAACDKAGRKDTEPPEGCGALLRIELVPLGQGKAAEPTCPPGLVWDGRQCASREPTARTSPTGSPDDPPALSPYSPRPRPTGARTSTPTTQQPQPMSGWFTASAYALSGGIAALAIGGIGALSAKKTAEAECEGSVCSKDGADARTRGRTMAIIANIGAGLTVLGVGFYFLAPRPGKTGPSVGMAVGPGNVSLGGEF